MALVDRRRIVRRVASARGARVPQPRELVEGSCADPATLYDGVFAVGATGRAHARLQRLL